MIREVDVAIIGAGTAGLNAMAQVRRAGKSFVLIDGGELGTTCARVGCMPSKAMIQVADDFHRRQIFARHGIDGGAGLSIDAEQALEHVRHLRDLFVDRVLGQSIDELGEDEFIAAQARFIAPQRLQAGEYEIHAGRVVIATGSSPQVPAEWRELGDRVISTDTVFELQTLPHSLAVIGLGAIGLELGQAFAHLGVDVVGYDLQARVGGLDDPVAAGLARELFGADFTLLLGESVAVRATAAGVSVRAGEHDREFDRVLVVMGRKPNLAGLDLHNLGVALDADGLPAFDPNSLQIGDLPVFIAGDANASRPILHEAGEQGRIAGYNAANDAIERFRRKTPMAVTFTEPGIALVGARWPALAARADLVVGEMRLGPVGRALIMGRNKGVIRLYAERGNGRLLGATLLCPGAEHLAHLLAWSIEMRQTVHDLLRMPFYHPTLEEALQGALYQLRSQLDQVPPGPPELRPLTAETGDES